MKVGLNKGIPDLIHLEGGCVNLLDLIYYSSTCAVLQDGTICRGHMNPTARTF